MFTILYHQYNGVELKCSLVSVYKKLGKLIITVRSWTAYILNIKYEC